MSDKPELDAFTLAQHALNRAFDRLKDAQKELGDAGYHLRQAARASRESKDEEQKS